MLLLIFVIKFRTITNRRLRQISTSRAYWRHPVRFANLFAVRCTVHLKSFYTSTALDRTFQFAFMLLFITPSLSEIKKGSPLTLENYSIMGAMEN